MNFKVYVKLTLIVLQLYMSGDMHKTEKLMFQTDNSLRSNKYNKKG
ncbi:hypothetical protein bsdtb5_41790 [Anaeromicropila herbilytica]|uniref:Uncharacterized protein n=1 Tax=Anaeromicropila herbilytica TaxID=2785025 RepID=A0A7R7IF73_9FIRM|nr:hypothetical protein bsdtb5_41790 [Anaeromicropila herbilytica]